MVFQKVGEEQGVLDGELTCRCMGSLVSMEHGLCKWGMGELTRASYIAAVLRRPWMSLEGGGKDGDL